MQLRFSKLLLSEVKLKKSQSHKLRGCIGEKFREFDLLHNHDSHTGKPIYRYPLFQFKVINDCPCILALTDKTTPLLKKLFLELRDITIEGQTLDLHEKMLESDRVEFGMSSQKMTYQFIIPWIGLNQENYKDYMSQNTKEVKEEILNKCLVGNILSLSKGLDYNVSETIQAETRLQPVKVILKGTEVLGFTGTFSVNFSLPNWIGIGKSVSRGYGTVERVVLNGFS